MVVWYFARNELGKRLCVEVNKNTLTGLSFTKLSSVCVAFAQRVRLTGEAVEELDWHLASLQVKTD